MVAVSSYDFTLREADASKDKIRAAHPGEMQPSWADDLKSFASMIGDFLTKNPTTGAGRAGAKTNDVLGLLTMGMAAAPSKGKNPALYGGPLPKGVDPFITDLVAKAKAGNVKAMQLLMEKSQEVIGQAVNKFRAHGNLEDDLKQAANAEAFMKAVQTYDPAKGRAFGSHLFQHARNVMSDEVRRMGTNTAPLPENLVLAQRAIRRVEETHYKLNGPYKPLTDAQIADKINETRKGTQILTEQDVRNARLAVPKSRSLQTTRVTPEGEERVVMPKGMPTVEPTVDREANVGQSLAAIRELPERERRILEMKYNEGMSDRAIADQLTREGHKGVSQQAINKARIKAEQQLMQKLGVERKPKSLGAAGKDDDPFHGIEAFADYQKKLGEGGPSSGGLETPVPSPAGFPTRLPNKAASSPGDGTLDQLRAPRPFRSPGWDDIGTGGPQPMPPSPPISGGSPLQLQANNQAALDAAKRKLSAYELLAQQNKREVDMPQAYERARDRQGRGYDGL